jgi:hypothetical protein
MAAQKVKKTGLWVLEGSAGGIVDGQQEHTGIGLDLNPPIAASHVPGMIGMCPQAQISLLRWILTHFLPRLAWNCNPPNLYLLNS